MIVNNNLWCSLWTRQYIHRIKDLQGAKRYATNHSFDKVGIRYNSGYTIRL